MKLCWENAGVPTRLVPELETWTRACPLLCLRGLEWGK